MGGSFIAFLRGNNRGATGGGIIGGKHGPVAERPETRKQNPQSGSFFVPAIPTKKSRKK